MTMTLNDQTTPAPTASSDILALRPTVSQPFVMFSREIALLVNGRAAVTERALLNADAQLSALGLQPQRLPPALLPVFAGEDVSHIPDETVRAIWLRDTSADGLPLLRAGESLTTERFFRLYREATPQHQKGLFQANGGPTWWLRCFGLDERSLNAAGLDTNGKVSPISAVVCNWNTPLAQFFFPDARERLQAGDALEDLLLEQIALLEAWTGHRSGITRTAEQLRHWQDLLGGAYDHWPQLPLKTLQLSTLKALPQGETLRIGGATLLPLPANGTGCSALLLRDGQDPVGMTDRTLSWSWSPDAADIAAAIPTHRLEVSLYSNDDGIVCDFDVRTDLGNVRSTPEQLRVTADPEVFWMAGSAQCYRADPARIARVQQAAAAYELLTDF